MLRKEYARRLGMAPGSLRPDCCSFYIQLRNFDKNYLSLKSDFLFQQHLPLQSLSIIQGIAKARP